MGKNWRGPKVGIYGNTIQGGGHDFASCRGHGVIIGTCDAARERETSKELVNLLNQAIEEVYPAETNAVSGEEEGKHSENEDEEVAPATSIENLLKAELSEVKQRKHSGTQNAVSIKTDVKGIVLIKLTRRKYCPIKLVNAIFERVNREQAPCCRHVVRMIPLKHVFFPNETDLRENLKIAIDEGLVELGIIEKKDVEERPAKRARVEPTSTEVDVKVDEDSETAVAVADSPKDEIVADESNAVVPSDINNALRQELNLPENYRKFPYLVAFKARNHNVLNKDLTVSIAAEFLRPFGYGDYRNPDYIIMVEALKNLCGISWMKASNTYDNYNIRKFQETLVTKKLSS